MSLFAFPPPALPGATGPAGVSVPAPPPALAPERRVLPLAQAGRGALSHDLFGRPPQAGHRAPPSLIQLAIAALLREQQAAAREASAGDPRADDTRDGAEAGASQPAAHLGGTRGPETACRSFAPALPPPALDAPDRTAWGAPLAAGAPTFPRIAAAPCGAFTAGPFHDPAFLTRSLRL
jgi:hypothetical protein